MKKMLLIGIAGWEWWIAMQIARIQLCKLPTPCVPQWKFVRDRWYVGANTAIGETYWIRADIIARMPLLQQRRIALTVAIQSLT